MPLMFYNGLPLFVDGLLAMSPDCCCEEGSGSSLCCQSARVAYSINDGANVCSGTLDVPFQNTRDGGLGCEYRFPLDSTVPDTVVVLTLYTVEAAPVSMLSIYCNGDLYVSDAMPNTNTACDPDYVHSTNLRKSGSVDYTGTATVET